MSLDSAAALLETLKARTHELAVNSGRVPPQVSQLEYEQAKREMAERFGDRDCVLPSLPEPLA